MPILSQILGTSFGRSPVNGNIGGVHMPPLMAPPEAHPMPRAVDASMEASPVRGAGGAASGSRPYGLDSVTGEIQDFAQQIRDIFANRRRRPGLGNPVPGAGGLGVPTSINPGVPTTPQARGIMGSIGQAFNSGAGGGMDMSKLLSMLPMIAG